MQFQNVHHSDRWHNNPLMLKIISKGKHLNLDNYLLKRLRL